MRIISRVALIFRVDGKDIIVRPLLIEDVPEAVKSTPTFELHYAAGNINILEGKSLAAADKAEIEARKDASKVSELPAEEQEELAEKAKEAGIAGSVKGYKVGTLKSKTAQAKVEVK